MLSKPVVDPEPGSERVTHPRAPAPLDLVVVIVSWNTRELLARCLSSILETTTARPSLDSSCLTRDLTFEVVVVDNGSVDDSAQMVCERFPGIRLIENHDNPGFARANNQAIQASSSRYVLLLNSDTEVGSGALEALVRFMDEHERVGAAGALLLNPDRTLQPSCHRLPSLGRELWRLFHLDVIYPLGSYRMDGWRRDRSRLVDVAQGACLIVRRAALDQIGLLDEGYFMYSEEVDLCRRLLRRGWTIHWVPWAEVVHYGGQSTRQVAEKMFLQLYRAKIRYFRVHDGRWAARLYKVILLLAASARLLVSPLAWLTATSRRGERLVLVSNYQQLIREIPWL